jgi:hypothetical protein
MSFSYQFEERSRGHFLELRFFGSSRFSGRTITIHIDGLIELYDEGHENPEEVLLDEIFDGIIEEEDRR